MKAILNQAYERRIPIEMIYLSKNEKITQRTVFIIEMNASSFKAFCFLRKQQRKFLIDNILSLRIVQKHFPHVS